MRLALKFAVPALAFLAAALFSPTGVVFFYMLVYVAFIAYCAWKWDEYGE